MTAGERAAENFKNSTREYCGLVVDLLQSVAPPGFSTDLQVCIRNGAIKVLPQPLYRSQNWKERGGIDNSESGGYE
jgi:hypothetical protein